MHQGKIEQLDTPEGIYQSPASRFIAEFVTQANFVPAVRERPGLEDRARSIGDEARQLLLQA